MDPRDDGGEEVDEFLKDARIVGTKEAQPLTNQEVAILLDKYRTANVAANPAFCPPPMVLKTQAYLDQVLAGVGRNEESAQVIRERVLTAGLEEAEMALLVNLMPENADEACALIPSLKRKEGLGRQELEELLAELHNFRTYH